MPKIFHTTPKTSTEDLISLTKRDLDDARARSDELSAALLENALNELLDGYLNPA